MTDTVPETAAIYLIEGAMLHVVDDIEAALIERDSSVVQSNKKLYIQSTDDVMRATAQLLRRHAMLVADFYKDVKRPYPHFEIADPALKYFEALLRKGEWRFPLLDSAPVGEKSGCDGE